jgi:cobalt-zinc-cadmium resistance protein CzcA
VRTLEDLGNIVVTQRNGLPVLVSDLGRLEYSHQEREGILGKDNANLRPAPKGDQCF